MNHCVFIRKMQLQQENILNGCCACNEECRQKCVICEAECKLCKKAYIGNTQQTYKSWMDGHFQDVTKTIIHGIKSDSFAFHFVQHFDSKPYPALLREMIDCKILWKGNGFQLVKTFGSSTCKLCMKE